MISVIRKELKNLKINDKKLRNFGLTFFVVLNVIAGCVYLKGSSSWPWVIAVSGLFLALGLLFPYLLKDFYKLWMGLAFLLGWIVTRVVLTLTFFLIFTPMAFLLRILGKDVLDAKINKNAGTYWRKHEPVSDRSRYLKQY